MFISLRNGLTYSGSGKGLCQSLVSYPKVPPTMSHEEDGSSPGAAFRLRFLRLHIYETNFCCSKIESYTCCFGNRDG